MARRLSKSKILSGLQCEKRLWLEVNKPELTEISADMQGRFDIGNQVNDVARNLNKGGVLIETGADMAGALAETRRVLDEQPGKPVFEASFKHQNVLVRADILRKTKKAHRLTEVKSSTSVKDYHYPDCAVQFWVLEGAGIPVDRVELAHINSQFLYQGDNNYKGILHHEDLTSRIRELKKDVPGWVKKFKQVLKGGEPLIETGDHCTTPYSCPFIHYCSESEPEYPLSVLPRGGKVAKDLVEEGIEDIRDIPGDRLSNPTHEKVRRITVSGKPELDPDAKKIINALPYPRYYLDFETTRFVVPIWKDTRPYQPLPFQWSCHIERKSGRYHHQEFLDTSGDAPMRRFVESLLDCVGDKGPIFVYSSFEASRLKDLADRFPDLGKSIKKVIDRLEDLLPITRKYYYHPDMLGSWSIKSVLPTITTGLGYDDLGEVQDGGSAESAYLELIHPDTGEERKNKLVNGLRAYCKRDTEAMIALARYLSTGAKVRYRDLQVNMEK